LCQPPKWRIDTSGRGRPDGRQSPGRSRSIPILQGRLLDARRGQSRCTGREDQELGDEIEEIHEEEKEKKLQSIELQLCKAENLIKHDDEIRGRPKRTWFEKELRGKVSKAQLKGLELPEKKVKLTNKKKQLEVRGEVEEERVYKKTKADRTSKRNGKGKGGKKFAQKILRGKGKSK